MLPFSPIRFLLRVTLSLAIFTAFGQVRLNNRSLENHYHDFVNSQGFQDWFWALAIPVTWSTDLIGQGFAKVKEASSSNKTEKAAR